MSVQPGRIAASLVVAALAAACGGGSTLTPAPTPNGTAEGRGPGPSSAPRSGGVIDTSAVVRVVADELRLRAEPATAGALVFAMPRGHIARVEAGPIEADGFRWWQLEDLDGRSGWAADGDLTDAWLAAPAPHDAQPLLVLRTACDVTYALVAPATTVLDDGTVVLTQGRFVPGDAAPPPWRVGVLSPGGLAHVRANVLGSPYLRTSAEFVAEPLPGAEPPGHGACLHEFTMGRDEIVVSAIGWFGDEEEAEFWQPSPERRTLTGIAENLIALDAVLDGDAWTTPPTQPYLATRFVVLVTESPAGPTIPGGAPELADDPLVGLADQLEPLTAHDRCGEISLAQAFDVAATLAATGQPQSLYDPRGGMYVVGQTMHSVNLVPQTPAGAPSCDDAAA